MFPGWNRWVCALRAINGSEGIRDSTVDALDKHWQGHLELSSAGHCGVFSISFPVVPGAKEVQ